MRLIAYFFLVALLVGGAGVYSYFIVNSEISTSLDIIKSMDDTAYDIRILLEEEFREVEEFANGFATREEVEEEIEEIERRISDDIVKLDAAAAAAAGLVTPEDVRALKAEIAEEDEIRERVFETRTEFVNTMGSI